MKVEYNEILSLKDAFTVVCNDDTEAEKLMTTSATTTCSERGFKVMSSAALKAKRTVCLKRLDKLITTQSIDELKASIEDHNYWATVEYITKIPNASSKCTFTNSTMTAQTLAGGMAIFYFDINSGHIDAERFQRITQCWSCYSYLHTTKDCPVKDKKKILLDLWI